jgi:hypothetical protein
MALEDDGNMGEDVAALFDSSVAPTNLDAADNVGDLPTTQRVSRDYKPLVSSNGVKHQDGKSTKHIASEKCKPH